MSKMPTLRELLNKKNSDLDNESGILPGNGLTKRQKLDLILAEALEGALGDCDILSDTSSIVSSDDEHRSKPTKITA